MTDQLLPIARDENVKDLPLSEQDKENFLKAVLVDEPYEENVSLLDGKVVLTFRALTMEQWEDHAAQVKLDSKNKVTDNDDTYFARFLSYRLAISLTKINGVPYLPEVTKEEFEATEEATYVAARTNPFKKWQAIKLSTYIDAFNQFERKLFQLAKEVQSPNFWKASK